MNLRELVVLLICFKNEYTNKQTKTFRCFYFIKNAHRQNVYQYNIGFKEFLYRHGFYSSFLLHYRRLKFVWNSQILIRSFKCVVFSCLIPTNIRMKNICTYEVLYISNSSQRFTIRSTDRFSCCFLNIDHKEIQNSLM